MTVVEISECFPNSLKPVTGEFILQHVRALSKYCKVTIIVPLRNVPPKELFSPNPFKTISEIYHWMASNNKMENITEGDLTIMYFRYISLPRPYFESIDNSFIKFFFHNRVKNLLKNVKPDIVYCNWIRPWAKLSSELADQLNIPFVIDHHEDIPTLKKIFRGKYKKLLSVFEKADAIVVHSSQNKNELLDEELKLPEVTINHLGQNFIVSSSKKEFNIDTIKMACVSHLYESRKNIDDLINAARHLKGKLKFQLTIAGEGNLKDKYIELSVSLGLSKEIIFAGKKTQDEISLLLDESDIFVLPSFPEAFGIVFTEALAKGLPVITCEGNGGGEELKLLGYPVILVKPNSPADLAEAILRLVKDRIRMSEMSEAGKKIVGQYFSWDRNAKSTYNYLKEVISKARVN